MRRGLGPRYKVLILSRNYPNEVMPQLGLWVEGSVCAIAEKCDLRVVAPTPYCPPLPGFSPHRHFRKIKLEEHRNGIVVFHPRLLVGPGNLLYKFEASAYYWSIRNQVDHLRRTFPFDLIHAHFGFPDGVVAAQLARRYGIPFIITEHASWQPWMDNYQRIRRQAVWASRQSAFHIAVSRFAKASISHFTGASSTLRVIHNGVDESIFTPPNGQGYLPNQILYVGVMRRVKGIDLLLRAMRRLVDQKPEARLVLVGGGFYRGYSQQEKQLHHLAGELGLSSNIEFVGLRSQTEVAQYMRESAVLVLPSRRETFGAVLIEALACGTPVIATNCGGPAEIVNEKVGLLVPIDDEEALTKAMVTLLEQRQNYDPAELRSYALSNFSSKRIAEQTLSLYSEAIESSRTSKPIADEINCVANGPRRFVEGS